LLELLDESADLEYSEPDEEDSEDDSFTSFDTADDEVAAGTIGDPTLETIHVLVKDRNESKVADIFRNLAYRVSIFGITYPFQVDCSAQEIQLRDIDSPLRKLYLQLLLSASLRLVPNTRRQELTAPFERIAMRIFSCLMPSGWEVHQFAAKGSTRYKGHLYKRLEKLAEDLRGKMLLDKTHFKTKNAGDGGLDIVAWHPMGNDDRVGIPIALAQCGCTAEEWSLKQLEASPARLESNFTTLHPWATYYFMPQDLVDGRASTLDWQRRASLTKCITVDRLRLIRLAEQYGVADECANAADRVAEAFALAVI
jgi:hypothetical protein